jgi:hypothetical protein
MSSSDSKLNHYKDVFSFGNTHPGLRLAQPGGGGGGGAHIGFLSCSHFLPDDESRVQLSKRF